MIWFYGNKLNSIALPENHICNEKNTSGYGGGWTYRNGEIGEVTEFELSRTDETGNEIIFIMCV